MDEFAAACGLQRQLDILLHVLRHSALTLDIGCRGQERQTLSPRPCCRLDRVDRAAPAYGVDTQHGPNPIQLLQQDA